ncbi:unnamed protein product [Prorocentrum cordatum]|uniref:Beta-galactosidase n=1 Tax=Prorocentrum cordatum TaxID=2364126 RepID=A0ABN9R9F0_9DINO|nr:unnamed protein product [Polarella glacialis]
MPIPSRPGWVMPGSMWIVSAVLKGGPRAWPGDPPAYPRYPGRLVHVLNGTWDFSMAVLLPGPPSWEPVEVPDAFDLRPDRPRCEECWPGDPARCGRCCDRSRGFHGDPTCWDDELSFEGGVWAFREAEPGSRGFRYCCGQDPLRARRGVAAYRAEVPSRGGAAAVLHFGGCAMRCLVAVDGQLLEDHAGLSPFWVDVPPGRAGRSREVLVLADNRFNSTTHPVHP